MTYAKEEKLAVKLALKSIEMHQINYQKENDFSLVSSKTGKQFYLTASYSVITGNNTLKQN